MVVVFGSDQKIKKSKKRRKEVVKCPSNPSLNAIKNCILFRDKYFSQLQAE